MTQRKAGDKPYDILVWGATGFTGTIIAEYLAQHAPEHVKLAIGGRNEKRLNEIKNELFSLSPRREIGILIGDAEKPATIDEVIKQTRVVVNAAGPFRKYGPPVADACVKFGTHYCDITGEPSWCKYLIDNHHESAKAKGVIIVPTCGFDSVPSDIGTWFLIDYVKRTYNTDCKNIEYILRTADGGVSGGTIASGVNELSSRSNSGTSDAYFLNPPNKKPSLPQPSDLSFVQYSKASKLWTIPFIMSAINTRVVQRTQALYDFKYGQFKYSEKVGHPYLIVSLAMWFGLFVFVTLLVVPFTRPIVLRFLPKPGEGPKKENLLKGKLLLSITGELNAHKASDPKHVAVEVTGKGDVGYHITSMMVAEAGLTLALDKSPTAEGGVLTPAYGLGNPYLERLNKNGLHFTTTKK